jgi:hypothetical protein
MFVVVSRGREGRGGVSLPTPWRARSGWAIWSRICLMALSSSRTSACSASHRDATACSARFVAPAGVVMSPERRRAQVRARWDVVSARSLVRSSWCRVGQAVHLFRGRGPSLQRAAAQPAVVGPIGPSPDFGITVASPDRTARAATSASTVSVLPLRSRVWRFVRLTSITFTPRVRRCRDSPAPHEPVPSIPTARTSP